MNKIYVINNMGERELFSPGKLLKSARRSGADKELADRVVGIISNQVRNEDRTLDIYRVMKSLLLKEERSVGIKFSLKESIRKLGPTGYPFEIYMAEVFKRHGFKTKVETFVKGKATDYEIDFQAEKEKNMYLAECKFHDDVGSRVDINVILIAYAGLLDMLGGKYCLNYKNDGGKIKRLVATNTKFTNKAISFAKCYGMDLLGWHYPEDGGIEKYIENMKLYPITILPSINKNLLEVFFNAGIIFCIDLLNMDEQKLIKNLHISLKDAQKIMFDAKSLLNNNEQRIG